MALARLSEQLPWNIYRLLHGVPRRKCILPFIERAFTAGITRFMEASCMNVSPSFQTETANIGGPVPMELMEDGLPGGDKMYCPGAGVAASDHGVNRGT